MRFRVRERVSPVIITAYKLIPSENKKPAPVQIIALSCAIHVNRKAITCFFAGKYITIPASLFDEFRVEKNVHVLSWTLLSQPELAAPTSPPSRPFPRT